MVRRKQQGLMKANRLTKELLEMAKGMHASGIMTKRAFNKIADGLREALSVARGEAKPANLVLRDRNGLIINDSAYEKIMWIRARIAYLDFLMKSFGWEK
jgi:hypothetical protein